MGGDKTAVGEIKALLTERLRVVEAKYQDPIQFPNYSRMIIASNSSWVAHVTEGDRRWQMVDLNEKWHISPSDSQEKSRAKREYFGEISRQWQDGGKEAFFRLMMLRDVKNFDFAGNRIATVATYEQLKQSSPVLSWLEACLWSGSIGSSKLNWDFETKIADTDSVYKSFLSDSSNWTGDKKSFSRNLKSLLPKTFDKFRDWKSPGNRTVWKFSSV